MAKNVLGSNHEEEGKMKMEGLVGSNKEGGTAMSDAASDKVVLTERECAERLGLSFWTLRKMRINGNAPHIKLGQRIYYVYDAVVDWLAQQAVGMEVIRTP